MLNSTTAEVNAFDVELVTLQGCHCGLVRTVTHGQLTHAESERHPEGGHDGEDDGVGQEEGDRGPHL